jgi:hypothetical protein
MEAYASSGYVTVAIDARHHGDRGHAPHAYAEALVAAWETGEEMPFIFDTVSLKNQHCYDTLYLAPMSAFCYD